ncbi:alanine racemase [Oricola cellulosilytica]|uniref:Alanine racemase n=1 Tax=Oricola cellulosilytica TaxID=1429082 RepID=A0A4R0PAM6_9HYPH|nr:alanine racemase [Oricola cellulosilytica]TCD14291.1 alanine racemase [Oricola cellulosilytica]
MTLVQRGSDPRLAGGRLTIDLDALAANWRDLAERSKPARCAAVVKANAYGLGVEQVVPALLAAGCDTFFVALPQEGVAARKIAPKAEIFVLNGVHEQSVATIAEAGLIPVLNSLEQIELWAGHCSSRGLNVACALGVDTGMNRLGLAVADMLAFRTRNVSEHVVSPLLVMSHLACADQPDHPLNRLQLESFQRVTEAFDDVESSLANSAGILLGGKYLFGVTRPGIALYGGAATLEGANPMRPVVTLEARIIQLREARKGETVSYGAAETLERATKIAVVAVGYADGYPRSGSSAGVPLRKVASAGQRGWIGGVTVPLLGRITMDLSMFDVTDVADDALESGWIELIGPNIPLDEAAGSAGTIGYELLTGLGPRYERRYIQAPES